MDDRAGIEDAGGHRISDQVQVAAFAVAAAVCVVVATGLLCSRLGDEGHAAVIEGRINPNDAPVASLVRLPGVGMVRATAIVSYREGYAGEGPAFDDCDDLAEVKGIGPVTVAGVYEYLKFEAD